MRLRIVSLSAGMLKGGGSGPKRSGLPSHASPVAPFHVAAPVIAASRGGSRFPGRMTDRAGRAAVVGGEKEVIAEYLPIGKKARPVFSGTGPGFML